MVLTALGIAINFVFNIVNYFRTKDLRNQGIWLDEFKRIRAGVDAALSDLRNERANLVSLQALEADAAVFEAQVAACQKKLIDCYGKLAIALGDLDRSQFALGEDWTSQPQDAWDRFSQAIDDAYTEGRALSLKKQAIAQAAICLDAISAKVQSRTEREIQSYSGRRKGHVSL